jgi:hypothetical protein
VRSVVREVEQAVIARPRRTRKDVMATMADEEKGQTAVGSRRSRALALT